MKTSKSENAKMLDGKYYMESQRAQFILCILLMKKELCNHQVTCPNS